MSITFPTIITADDYREFQQGNNSPVSDTDITSAINTTFIQLNGICNNQIMLRWNLTEGDDKLNDTQKNLIQQAFLLQTKYNLDYDNDTSEGTMQSSFGANTYSSTRPRRDKITQDILNLLNRAGVYSQVTVSSVTRSPLRPTVSGANSQWNPMFDSFVTIELANARFVPKFWSQDLAGKILYINDNGIVDTKTESGGGSTTYTGTNGIVVDNTNHTIGISTTTTTPIQLPSIVLSELTTASGAQIDFGGSASVDLDANAICDTPTSASSNQAVTNREYVDNKIATETAHFLGTYIGGTTRPDSFDYDTFIKSQIPSGTTVTNNDYVFVLWTEKGEYDRCKYNSTTSTWEFEFSLLNDIIPFVTISAPASATSGTLTADELKTLQSSDNSYIMFNNEKYYLNDKEHTAGSLGYSHIGFENNVFQFKNITVTIATRGWVLNKKTYPELNWWDETASLTTADIGTIKEVEVNGIKHKVRLIGIDKDTIAGTSTKAHTTWEFVDLISDTNGYSLATFWKDTNDASTSNFDYLNSDIRKAIDGQGTGTANWFEKSATTWSTTYAGKSVLDMLPTALKSKLKTVTKIVNENTGGSWVETSYNTNLFLLSPKEMGYSSIYAETGVTTYDYYVGKTSQTDASRIKKQFKGTDGALTSSTTVTSGAYTGSKYSYAGYNNSTSGYGGTYYLRSPNTNYADYAWGVYYSGFVINDGVYRYAYGVSPCFCI